MTRTPHSIVLENTVEIERSADVVFDYCSDPIHEAEWNPKLQRIAKISEGPVAVGARYEADFGIGGTMTIECTQYDRPTTWATVGQSPRLRASLEGRVLPTPSGARLFLRMELQPKGPLRYLSSLIRPRMKHAQTGHLAVIKRRLETDPGSPTQQDHEDATGRGETAPSTALERVLPSARLIEQNLVDLAVPPEQAWALIRHRDFARMWIARALFAIRSVPSRLTGGEPEPAGLRIDNLTSTPEHPGFQVLVDHPPREFVVGAIGKVWRANIPFVHVPTADAFAAFDEPGYIKVAWAMQFSPLRERTTRLVLEVRVDATDETSWRKFRQYFRFIGPASRFIRRALLASLAREHGTLESNIEDRALPGDELLPDAGTQVTHSATIRTRPEQLWPWLVQMGCRRAGFYSIDILDNAGRRSARAIHPELQQLHIGDILPATPKGDDGFEVLDLEPNRALVLGGLYDPVAKRQLPFAAPRPARFWHVTWAFALEPQDDDTTRLDVRARVCFPPSGRRHATWIRPVHHVMQTAQLRHLATRVEERAPRDDWRDIAEGIAGAAIMAADLVTPFLRGARSHWGIDTATAAREYPGDELVLEPRWSWTHGIEINAPLEDVWPWIAQIGADRGGFYSYQWLENLAGCQLRNAETLHPEWTIRDGGELIIHPKMPPLRIVRLQPGRSFVAYAGPEPRTGHEESWVAASWLFFLEPLDPGRCRFISRYRCATSNDLPTRLQYGPTLIEPIGFAMDRRMLLGVKERAEQHRRNPPTHY
jgi:Polyketide cyclase / dehydrase and lipid transport